MSPKVIRRGLVALLLLASVPAAGGSPGDVAKSWEAADAYVRIEDPDYRFVVISGPMRAPFMQRILDRLAAGDRRPAIVHLHGCSYRPGDPDVRVQARYMASLGYVVVVPNSFRREGRPATCDPRRFALRPEAPIGVVHRMRLEELAYAVERVRRLPWVRPGPILISGYSEGAEAVMDFSHAAVGARIAIAPSCRFGIDLSRPVPTLILVSRGDRWYRAARDPAGRRHCGRYAGADPYVEFYEPEGSMHNTLIYRDSQFALWDFLARVGY